MTTYVKDNLYLDNIISTNGIGEQIVLPDAEGLRIRVKTEDNQFITIAYVYWDILEQDCYIQTVRDNFQTYVVLSETFGNFICLIDEAYDIIRAANIKQNINTTTILYQ